MKCHFRAQSENNSDSNFYPVSPEHKGKSVLTTEELFSTLLERCFKIKNHEEIYTQNNSFYIKQPQTP